MAELSTIERLTKERDHIDDILYLLEVTKDIDRAIAILKRDRESINESLQTK